MTELSSNQVVRNFENYLWMKLNKYYSTHKRDYKVNKQVNGMRTELRNIEIFQRHHIKESAIMTANNGSRSTPIFLIKEILNSKLTLGRALVVVYFVTKLCKQCVAMKREDLIDHVIVETQKVFIEFSYENSVQKFAKLVIAPIQYTIITFSLWVICKSIYSLINVIY